MVSIKSKGFDWLKAARTNPVSYRRHLRSASLPHSVTPVTSFFKYPKRTRQKIHN